MSGSAEAVERIRSILEGGHDRAKKVERVAAIIREAGRYRWVGIYEVDRKEISVIAWSGPNAPAHPRFPASQGLCGSAVKTRAAVVVGDVTKDPCYLTTFGSTRSEIIVPILPAATEPVLGTIDVESEQPNAFTEADRIFLEKCASVLAGLWESSAWRS